MKTNAKFSLVAYFLLLIPLGVAISLGIVLYSFLSEKVSKIIIVIILTAYVLIVASIFALIDAYRRTSLLGNQVKQILEATNKIANGDFDVTLVPEHTHLRYDEYDCIMENINKMAKELAKSEILKNDFISNVSHEIKTPLAVIKNHCQALLNSNLSQDTRKEYLHILIDTTTKLSNLVTNILSLNRLDNQTLSNKKERVNVGELLRECILVFDDVIEKKKINLVCNISDIEMSSYASYLEIIFNNLISNAVKFSHLKGEIEVSLKNQGNYIIFQIKDNGIGICEEDGKRIFERFFKADKSRSSGGNGLGLALVKKIIDIIGGEISVKSQEGVGSTFIVKLIK